MRQRVGWWRRWLACAALLGWSAVVGVLVVLSAPELAGAGETAAIGTAAAGDPASPASPDQVRVGLYITQLYDFDQIKRAFTVTFWMWFVHNNARYLPLESVEVVNAKSTTLKFPSTSASEGGNWVQGKYTATIAHDWDVRDFPFDREHFEVVLEDGRFDANAVRLVADAANSRVDQSVSVLGWVLERFDIKSVDAVYDTTFGDPSLQGTSTYSRVIGTVTMKRQGWRLLLSLYVGFFVAFGLTLLVYLLDISAMVLPRISLCAGAIFAAVGNKYVIDNTLPPTPSFGLSDGIQITSFGAILLTIFLVVAIEGLRARGAVERAATVNRWAGAVTAVVYFGINGAMVARVAF